LDEQIIQLLKNENEEGLTQLQGKYANLIRYIIRGVLTDKRDADECLSDIYFQIWRKFSTFDRNKGSLSTWVTVIARNTALNYKKKSRMVVAELAEEGSTALSPEVLVLEKESQKSLARIMV